VPLDQGFAVNLVFLASGVRPEHYGLHLRRRDPLSAGEFLDAVGDNSRQLHHLLAQSGVFRNVPPEF
jgi:hypothetical protein